MIKSTLANIVVNADPSNYTHGRTPPSNFYFSLIKYISNNYFSNPIYHK